MHDASNDIHLALPSIVVFYGTGILAVVLHTGIFTNIWYSPYFKIKQSNDFISYRSTFQHIACCHFCNFDSPLAQSLSMIMTDFKQTVLEDEMVAGEATRGTAIDQDRDTFLPRPSDDPNDPLNWPMYLKVSITKLYESQKLIFHSDCHPASGLCPCRNWDTKYSHYKPSLWAFGKGIRHH